MITTIIFDLGGVLVDWNPDYVFDKVFEGRPDDKQYFYGQICTSDWNEEQDAGRSISEATQLLVDRHPEWKEHIEAYYGRWEEMLGGPIEGTVDLFRQLKESGRYKIYALSNWSAETFPIALQRYDFLHWFDGRVVSGEERMRKPFPDFYQLLLDRYGVRAEECFFIDDNERNVKAAEAMGIRSHRFTSPEGLQTALQQEGLL
ncbi:HAD family phosphatase [Flaviaesturariibacter amylovorans]|uniref:HAD-IA family hydrolase n=1 Tax=Flaviaesturariibacter amylovorans TaxID=1084520 RepID=A0ABP8HV03_9BACT